MIAVLGGLGAAFAFSIAILAYARATRLLDPFAVLSWVMVVGLVLVIPAILLVGLPVSFSSQNLFWLLVVGLGNVVGLLLQFAALRLGKAGIVATIVSTEGAIAAVLAVASGDPLTAGLAAALAVVAIGVVVTTIVPDELTSLGASSTRRAVVLASGAAFLFGVGLFAVGRVGDEVSVAWILVPARIIGVAGIAVPLLVTRRLRLVRPAVPLLVVAGVAEVAGFVSFAIGARDLVAVSAVLASQFAAISLVLAFVFFGERVSRMQLAGIVLVIAGVVGVVLLQG